MNKINDILGDMDIEEGGPELNAVLSSKELKEFKRHCLTWVTATAVEVMPCGPWLLLA